MPSWDQVRVRVRESQVPCGVRHRRWTWSDVMVSRWRHRERLNNPHPRDLLGRFAVGARLCPWGADAADKGASRRQSRRPRSRRRGSPRRGFRRLSEHQRSYGKGAFVRDPIPGDCKAVYTGLIRTSPRGSVFSTVNFQPSLPAAAGCRVRAKQRPRRDAATPPRATPRQPARRTPAFMRPEGRRRAPARRRLGAGEGPLCGRLL
jgi:hypothetical protein